MKNIVQMHCCWQFNVQKKNKKKNGTLRCPTETHKLSELPYQKITIVHNVQIPASCVMRVQYV